MTIVLPISPVLLHLRPQFKWLYICFRCLGTFWQCQNLRQFTREDTISLTVPETKFNGPEGEMLGQLGVTPEVAASKINNLNESK